MMALRIFQCPAIVAGTGPTLSQWIGPSSGWPDTHCVFLARLTLSTTTRIGRQGLQVRKLSLPAVSKMTF